MSRDELYLRDMLRSARRINSAVASISREAFMVNEDLQDIVIRRFLVIGGAARRVSPERQQSLSSLPWPQIISMRNMLVHNYDEINLPVVWDTIINDLPYLIAALEPLVGPAVRPELWEGLLS
jgi:uncharacterized protein with HEPN domain